MLTKLNSYYQRKILQIKRNRKLTAFDTTLFFRQFATLIVSGIPLIKALELLEQSQDKLIFQTLLYMIKRDILSGKSIYHSLYRHPRYFSDFTCRLIQIGELTGKLDTMLLMIAAHQEKQQTLRQQIKQVMFYPAIIAIVGF